MKLLIQVAADAAWNYDLVIHYSLLFLSLTQLILMVVPTVSILINFVTHLL